MTLGALALFAITLFVAAGSPGPSVAALVARVLARGHRDVLPFLAARISGGSSSPSTRLTDTPKSIAF